MIHWRHIIPGTLLAFALCRPAAAPPHRLWDEAGDNDQPGESASLSSRGGGFELRSALLNSPAGNGMAISTGGRFTLIGGMSMPGPREDESTSSSANDPGAAYTLVSDDECGEDPPDVDAPGPPR